MLKGFQEMSFHGNKLLQSFNEKFSWANLLENNICEDEISNTKPKEFIELLPLNLSITSKSY